MNRLLIVLCVVGWALYIVHTNSNTGGELVAQNANTSAAPSPITQASATSIGSERHPTASAAVRSSHAISPDETPPQPPTNLTAPSEATLSPPLPEPPGEVTSRPGFNPEPGEQLMVTSETSIHSGPSSSAQVIGNAHTGATLRVNLREADWVQFLDPVASKSGWISLAYLAPTDRNADVQSTVPLQSKKPTKAAKLKSPKPIAKVRRSAPTYAELPIDQEFAPKRRGGLFGMFGRRRFSDLPPPPY